jgi:hypothetical protein
VQQWIQPQNKSLLESRKTQRQNVSFYFSNNDQKLIPTRRTNYLIGAQSTTLPLVAAAAYVPGASLLSSHIPVVGNLHSASDDKGFLHPAILNPQKQAAMRGTLEYNQQKLINLKRKPMS